ncbi:hypothetical protein CU097_002884, partial [Rhizopus azygosporus]
MAAKKRSLENDARAIGNHVNLRVLVQAKGTHEDALSDEFAGSIPGPQKFTGDHTSACDGEVKAMKLNVPCLYTVQHFSSVPIPNDAGDLDLLRKKYLPRLEYMK